MLVPPAYLLATVLRRRPLRLRSFELPLPSPTIAIGQALLSAVEWALAGAVLYVLLPPSGLSFLTFLGAFLIAILLGMASHVPGGVGVFEGLMVLLLRPYLTSGQLLPALVVYRAVYYLLPLAVALVGLVADEVRQRRAHAARVGAALGELTEQLTPRVLAVFTFLAGLVLLFSGATPAAAGRLELLSRVLPLGVIEASHFLGSVAGAVLLILSQGLARRLDAAYYLTAGTIVAGMAASLLKGFDYEEAALLLLVFAGVVAGAAGLRSPRRLLRHALLRGVDRRAGRRARRLGVARVVRVQARGLLARALVAVRGARRGVAISPGLGRRGDGAAAVRIRPPDRLRPPRGTDADRRRPRRRRPGDRRADVDVPLSGVSPGQGAAVQRRSHARSSCTACRDAPGSRSAIRSDPTIGSTISFAAFSSAATTLAACRSSTRSARPICIATPTSA